MNQDGFRSFALAFAIVGVVIVPPTSRADGANPNNGTAEPTGAADAGRFVVGFHGALPPQLIPGLTRFEGSLLRVDDHLGFAIVEPGADLVDAFLEAAQAWIGVDYVVPDGRVSALQLPVPGFVPNDPEYPNQWGPPAIHVPEVWSTWRGDTNITVSIIDTGIDYTHPDLADNVCSLGPDYVNEDADPMDDHAHGTHVAGTVAGVINNGVGVAGMGNVCLQAVKILDADGWGYWSDLASAIRWAADNDADIISMSLGGCPGCPAGPAVEAAIQYADAAGVLIIAAAGNAHCEPVSYPAAYPAVVAVAALQAPGDERAEFGSCGPKVEVSAPGDRIISTVPFWFRESGYEYFSGTSMATPHTSGVAALWWSAHPAVTAMDVRCVLWQNADDLGAPGRDEGTGHGRINAQQMFLDPACHPTPPEAPALEGFQGDRAGALAWTTPFAWGAPLSGYEILRGPAPDALTHLVTVGVTNHYRDGDADLGSTYYYAVRGLNEAGAGAPSNVVNVTIREALALPYVLGFEEGLDGWAATGQWHVATDRPAFGTHSAYFGQERGEGLDDNTYAQDPWWEEPVSGTPTVPRGPDEPHVLATLPSRGRLRRTTGSQDCNRDGSVDLRGSLAHELQGIRWTRLPGPLFLRRPGRVPPLRIRTGP